MAAQRLEAFKEVAAVCTFTNNYFSDNVLLCKISTYETGKWVCTSKQTQLEKNCLCSKVAFAIGSGRVPHKSFLFQAQSPAKKKKKINKPKQKNLSCRPNPLPSCIYSVLFQCKYFPLIIMIAHQSHITLFSRWDAKANIRHRDQFVNPILQLQKPRWTRLPGMLKHTRGFGAQQYTPRSLRPGAASTCSPCCTQGRTRITLLHYACSRDTPCIASLSRYKHFQVHSEEPVWFSFWLLPGATQSSTNLTLLGPHNTQMPICQP